MPIPQTRQFPVKLEPTDALEIFSIYHQFRPVFPQHVVCVAPFLSRRLDKNFTYMKTVDVVTGESRHFRATYTTLLVGTVRRNYHRKTCGAPLRSLCLPHMVLTCLTASLRLRTQVRTGGQRAAYRKISGKWQATGYS